MARENAIAPIATEGEGLTLQGYTVGITNEVSTWLSAQMTGGEFHVPEGYDVKGEVTSAMMKLMNTKVKRKDDKGNYGEVDLLSVISKDSVVMFMKDMVSQGLSFSRNQCYAVPYGSELKLQRSYFGTIAALSAMFPLYEVSANVIFKGDTYDYLTDALHGYNFIDNHKSSIENRDKGIVAAYGYIYDRTTNTRVYGCVMTKAEIDVSWSHAKTKNVQEEFPQEMAKRTLINRMCKLFINSKPSNLSSAQFDAYVRSTENEYESRSSADEDEQKAPSAEKGGRKFDRLMAEKTQSEEIPF